MGRRRSRPCGAAGQASVEWVALALLTVFVLAGAGALASSGGGGGGGSSADRALGELVGSRLTCAAGGSCAAPGPVPPATALGRRAATGARPSGAGLPRARVINALRRLRAAGLALARRAWIVCLGYRSLRRELEHPRPPNEFMPLDEAFEIAHLCLNPIAFLVDG